ncbi:hypothetical protein D9C01_13970, partial [Corynebacterium diphtheriae]
GAAHHVAELSQSERDAIAMYVNLDMVAPLDHQNTLGVGAAHHVAELSQSERDAIAMYVNLDMVAPLDHQ